jgi:hypothetical protein
MGSLPYDLLADLFPLMAGEEFAQLAAAISAKGPQEPAIEMKSVHVRIKSIIDVLTVLICPPYRTPVRIQFGNPFDETSEHRNRNVSAARSLNGSLVDIGGGA